MKKNSERGTGVVIGMVLGFLVWVLVSYVADGNEPWDSSGDAYFMALFFCGLTGHFIYPKSNYFMALGIFFGQNIALLVFSRLGPLFPIGILFLFFYTMAAVIGIWIAKSFKEAYK